SWSETSGPNTGTFSNYNLYNSNFYNVIGGAYLLKWTSTNKGCVKSDFVLINNYDSTMPSFAGNDTTVCPPYTNLNAGFTGNHSASWTQISGPNTAIIISGIDPKTRVENLIKGTYLFEWVVINGYCPPTRDTVEITILYDEPSSPFAGNDTIICNQDSIQLRGNSPLIGSGLWSQISGTSVNFIDDTLYNTFINNLDTGLSLFEWQIENGNCSYQDTFSLLNQLLPTQAICNDDSGYCLYTGVQLKGNSPLIGEGHWYAINNTANILNPDLDSSLVTGLNAGIFNFEWVISNGVCEPSRDTMSITIDSIPSLSDAGPDIITCNISTKMSATVPSLGTGLWTQLSGMNTPDILTPNSDSTTIYGLDSGIYKYIWTVSKGVCKSVDTMAIVLQGPQENDQCNNPIQITDPGGTFYGDLCGAKTYGTEPNTAGYMACNTIFYRFRTVGYSYNKQITINLQNMNNCPYGLRISLFDSAACPGLGVQHDTTIIANTSGYYLFDSLKANQTYILVIDEYRNPCSKTSCNLVFSVGGNALPMSLLNFEANSLSRESAEINWTSIDDRSLVLYQIIKTENGQSTKIGDVTSKRNFGITSYKLTDKTIQSYPVAYELLGINQSGDIESFGTRVLFADDQFDDITLFPNPTQNYFNIQYTGEASYRLSTVVIFNSNGQEILRSQDIRMSNGLYTVDTENWSPGLYHVMVIIGEKVYRLKVIVE
ncbi:MAG: T9SS type A sorting domain-containing protein, partial [Bacteroidia bacterium]|nr:T9SS type A sorting domain-containing protein [Bacteroidia bacterium]